MTMAKGWVEGSRGWSKKPKSWSKEIVEQPIQDDPRLVAGFKAKSEHIKIYLLTRII